MINITKALYYMNYFNNIKYNIDIVIYVYKLNKQFYIVFNPTNDYVYDTYATHILRVFG